MAKQLTLDDYQDQVLKLAVQRYGVSDDRFTQLLDLGIRMREAQRRYFQTRDRADLIDCKKLEREFDALTAAVKP